jgi:ABC-type sugar transport system substrate-binding protein
MRSGGTAETIGCDLGNGDIAETIRCGTTAPAVASSRETEILAVPPSWKRPWFQSYRSAQAEQRKKMGLAAAGEDATVSRASVDARIADRPV